VNEQAAYERNRTAATFNIAITKSLSKRKKTRKTVTKRNQKSTTELAHIQ
jgi:hypothetical protein